MVKPLDPISPTNCLLIIIVYLKNLVEKRVSLRPTLLAEVRFVARSFRKIEIDILSIDSTIRREFSLIFYYASSEFVQSPAPRLSRQ